MDPPPKTSSNQAALPLMRGNSTHAPTKGPNYTFDVPYVLYSYVYFFVVMVGDVSLNSESVIIVPSSTGWGGDN